MNNKAQERKNTPVYSGVVAFFPNAMREIAKVSLAGNKQHDLGHLHFNPSVSADDSDAGLRHSLDHSAGIIYDDDGTMHLAKKAWRACAELERYLTENANKKTKPSGDNNNAYCEDNCNDCRTNSLLQDY